MKETNHNGDSKMISTANVGKKVINKNGTVGIVIDEYNDMRSGKAKITVDLITRKAYWLAQNATVIEA